MEQVLAIRQEVFGEQHQRTIKTVEELARVRQLAQQPHREAVDVGHYFRTCHQCRIVKDNRMCTCILL